MEIVQRPDGLIVHLPTGETLQLVVEPEGRLGNIPCRVRIRASAALIVLPDCSNVVQLTTPACLALEASLVAQTVAQNRAISKPAAGDSAQ